VLADRTTCFETDEIGIELTVMRKAPHGAGAVGRHVVESNDHGVPLIVEQVRVARRLAPFLDLRCRIGHVVSLARQAHPEQREASGIASSRSAGMVAPQVTQRP
jgi:hypothetical protein